MATHWHDTPLFEQIRDARVAFLKSTDEDEATHICKHHGMDYFMREPRSGRTWFLCERCCRKNVELELLVLSDPPSLSG